MYFPIFLKDGKKNSLGSIYRTLIELMGTAQIRNWRFFWAGENHLGWVSTFENTLKWERKIHKEKCISSPLWYHGSLLYSWPSHTYLVVYSPISEKYSPSCMHKLKVKQEVLTDAFLFKSDTECKYSNF